MNRPEYVVDFSLRYHLAHDGAAAAAAAGLRAGMGGGDRTADGRLWLDGGAGDFQARGESGGGRERDRERMREGTAPLA